ncbi:MAG: hypothetical protein ACOC1K_00900 [Nanoarchaeota archaeon]
MSTNLTGIPRETCKGAGGLLNVYITEFSNISDVSVSNGVASFSSDAGVWKKYVLGKESGSEFTSTGSADVAAGTKPIYENTLTMIFKRNQVSKRNELAVMGECELVAVISDNDFQTGATNGNLYIIGLENGVDAGGADVTAPVLSTGTQLGESNTMTIVIRALEAHPPYAIDTTTYTNIVEGNAVV